MDLEPRGARELILWKLGDALEEVVCDSHGTHGVRTRRSGAHLVELLERCHDWALRGLDHPEFGRKSGSCRSRLGSCFARTRGGPEVPHPVEWQPPHELPEAPITLSNLSIALSPFEKAVPCLLRAFEQPLLKARAQMRLTRHSSSLYSRRDGRLRAMNKRGSF